MAGRKARLTPSKLRAMQSALIAALAGEGFDGGDFADDDPDDFKSALRWVTQQLNHRASS